MAVAGLQATGQGSSGAVTLICALTKNMGGPTTKTQGVQLPPTPPTQPVQQPAGAAVVTTQTATQKGAFFTKLLAMDDAETKEDLEGKQELKAQVFGATSHSPHHDENNHLGVRCQKIAHHQSSTFGKQVFRHQRRCGFAPKENRISRRTRGIFNTGVNTIAKNWYKWRTKKVGDNNADFDTHF